MTTKNSSDKKKCGSCNGTGNCSHCGGTGKEPGLKADANCRRCGGTGVCPGCGGNGWV